MQFLTGDRIDNIVGVKGIGPVKANKLLTLAEGDEEQMFSICVEHLGYDRAVENGRLLYLRRQENEIWNPPSSTPSSSSTKTEQTVPSTKQEA